MKALSNKKTLWIMLLTAIEVLAVVVLLMVSQAAAGSQLFEFSLAESEKAIIDESNPGQNWKDTIQSGWSKTKQFFDGDETVNPELLASEPIETIVPEINVPDTFALDVSEPGLGEDHENDLTQKFLAWWEQVKADLSLPEIDSFEPIESFQDWWQQITSDLTTTGPALPGDLHVTLPDQDQPGLSTPTDLPNPDQEQDQAGLPTPIELPNQDQDQTELITAIETLNYDSLSYQGFLTDNVGQPVNGLHEMTFRLYNSPTSDTPIWEEARLAENAVPVQTGLFNLGLGSLVPLPNTLWEQTELYLGITIGSETEMTPRQKLGAVPVAASADIAQLALSVPDGSIEAGKLAADIHNYFIQSGEINCDETTRPDWTLDIGTGERSYTRHVSFENTYAEAPFVMVSITGFDVVSDYNPRLVVSAENIGVDGFDLVFSTWGDSLVNFVSASWLAYGL